MQVIQEGKSLIKAWADEIEVSALAQLRNVARLPFIHKHVAVMPDVHWGMGATVGSVIATKGAVVPAAVGVDIGCGMMAVRTTLFAGRVREHVKAIREGIEMVVPVGFNSNPEIVDSVGRWEGWINYPQRIQESLAQKAMHQMGTLGGGNHFIEICLDENDAVWVMLHSGSRNVGKTLADIHITRAKGVMKQMFIDLPDPDLAYFAHGTEDFKTYLEDLHWCQDYAAANRQEMMRRVMGVLAKLLNDGEPLERLVEVNCHHNYAAWEHHFGENVLVTRKGAVRARQGDMGIIPGSMGTRSYIVRGLGNPDAFCSCSHGAGRSMSRKEAKRRFQVADLKRMTEGVECRKDSGVLDEIPGAYKDIDEVMAQQSDLVEVVATLKQIMCVKG